MAGLPTLGLPHGALKKRTSHVLMKRTCRVSTTDQNQFARSERRRHGFLPRTVCGRATNSLLFLPSFVVVAGLQTRAVLPFSLWGELPRPLFFSSPLSRCVIEATCFWRGTVRSTGPREVINST